MHMMNQTTVKPVPMHTAYCNFKHFRFAIQNSQIAIEKIILLCKFNFLHCSFAMQIFSNEIIPWLILET